jgi:hypothetical protein
MLPIILHGFVSSVNEFLFILFYQPEKAKETNVTESENLETIVAPKTIWYSVSLHVLHDSVSKERSDERRTSKILSRSGS